MQISGTKHSSRISVELTGSLSIGCPRSLAVAFAARSDSFSVVPWTGQMNPVFTGFVVRGESRGGTPATVQAARTAVPQKLAASPLCRQGVMTQGLRVSHVAQI